MSPRNKARTLRQLKVGESFRLHGQTYIKGGTIRKSLRNDKLVDTVKCTDLNGEILFVPLDIHIKLD